MVPTSGPEARRPSGRTRKSLPPTSEVNWRTNTMDTRDGGMEQASGEKAVLKVQGVHAGYGPIRILHGIDLEIRQGEVVSLLGANGAGKTTLARVVGGWCDIYEGAVEFNGLDMHAWAPYKRARHGLAHVLEGRHLIP